MHPPAAPGAVFQKSPVSCYLPYLRARGPLLISYPFFLLSYIRSWWGSRRSRAKREARAINLLNASLAADSSLYFYISIFLYLYIPIFIYFFLSIFLYFRISIFLYFYMGPSIFLYFYISIFPYFYISISLYFYISTSLYFYISLFLYFHISIFLYFCSSKGF